MSSAHPAVDIITAKSAVVIQDRPLVPLSSWLTDAMSRCAANGQPIQILTPHDARITLPLRLALSGPTTRWVAQEPDGDTYYDGFSGLPLVWDGGAFALAEGGGDGPSATFLTGPPPDAGRHLMVSLTLVHEATAGLELGGTMEALSTALTGVPPVAWGTAEPALSRWSPSEITDLGRRRAPQATYLIFMGPHGPKAEVPPSGGTARIARVTSGVKETVSFGVAYPADREPPLDDLAALADEYAKAGTLQTMTAQWAPGRADLTFPARWYGAPVPIALAVGPEGVAEAGVEHALAAEAEAKTIGDPAKPGIWYALEDGDGAWTRLSELMEYLRDPGAGSSNWRGTS
ncbi:DUF6177 family protein [Spirillospora sp. CA-294931]|uniref:DUF6177 family protein n=1 Tax=Spirillospora sp. CA-294931 TaxID=3240042 RepID=UPI003D8BF585